jgi:hypothetical protein
MKSQPASTPACTVADEPGTTGTAGQPAAGVRGAWTVGRAPFTPLSAREARIDALYNLVICALVLLGTGVGAMLLVDFLHLR